VTSNGEGLWVECQAQIARYAARAENSPQLKPSHTCGKWVSSVGKRSRFVLLLKKFAVASADVHAVLL
jgi:hypothetical protein